MKYKVRLTHTVEMLVEGKSEEAVQDWLNNTTPTEAMELAVSTVDEFYRDEIICPVREDSIVDYVIKED